MSKEEKRVKSSVYYLTDKGGQWVVFCLNGKINARINTKTGAIETPKYKGRKKDEG